MINRTIKLSNLLALAVASSTLTINAHAAEFEVGETTVSIGGFVDVDVNVTSTSDGELPGNSNGRNFFIAQTIPVVADESNVEDSIDTDFTAQTSRLKFSTSTPTEMGDLKTHIETDFAVSDFGNEVVSNSFQLRLRRAYIDFKGFRVGQEWSTFQGLHALPEMATFLVASESVVFQRTPQIRYTTGNWQFALENPNTNVGGGIGLANDSVIPEVVVRRNHKTDRAHIALAVIGRELAYEDIPTDIDSTALGIGASLTGRIKVGNKGDDIRFAVTGGEGLGRYVGLGFAPGAYVDSDGELEAVPSIGGNIAYRKVFGKTSLSVGASMIEVDNDPSWIGVSETTNKSARSAQATLTHRILPKLTVAGEVLYGQLEQESGDRGDLRRFTVSFRRDF